METVQLFELEAPCGCCLARIDVAKARSVFASLMDRTLPEIQARRLDQDEVLLEQHATMRDRRDPEGVTLTVALSAIGDPADWVRAFDACRQSVGLDACDPETADVLSLRLHVVREVSPPIFNPFESSQPAE